VKSLLFGSFSAAAALAFSAGPASALVLVTATLDPFAAGLSSQISFTTNNYTVSDFATIVISAPDSFGVSNFTQTATLQLESFKLGSMTVLATNSGLRNGTGPSSYGLYITIATNGKLTNVAPGINVGSYTSVNYSFIGDPGNTDTVSPAGLVDHGTPDILLATGVLAPPGTGPNQVILANGLPSADVFVTLTPVGNGIAFFALPPGLGYQEASFTNTSTVTGISTNSSGVTTVTINGGGGNATLADLPEPASIGLLGAGLVGIAVARRRFANRA